MNKKKLKLTANLPIQEPKSQKLTPMKIEDKLLLNWTMRGPSFKGQKGDKGEATWPRGLPPSTPTSHPCNHQSEMLLVGITLWCILIATPGETPAVKAIEKHSYCMYS